MDRVWRDFNLCLCLEKFIEENHRANKAGARALGLHPQVAKVIEYGDLGGLQCIKTSQREIRTSEKLILRGGLLQGEGNDPDDAVELVILEIIHLRSDLSTREKLEKPTCFRILSSHLILFGQFSE